MTDATDMDRVFDNDEPSEDVASGRYTMAEAAKIKGVSYHTVSRAVRSGRLAAQRLGRMALIDAPDLSAWKPMRERAPRKYRRDAPASSEHPEPAIVQALDVENRRVQLTTAVLALHESSAKRTVDEFGDWLASLTASLLGLHQVIVWRADEVSGQFLAFGSVAVPEWTLPPQLSGHVAGMLRQLGERDEVVRLAPEALESEDAWSALPFAASEPLVVVPCRVGVRLVGTILGTRPRHLGSLGGDDLWMAQQFGAQVAVAMEHVEMRRLVRESSPTPLTVDADLPVQILAVDRGGYFVHINQEVTRTWGDNLRERYLGRHYAHFVGLFRRERLDGSVVRMEDHPITRALRGDEVKDEQHLVPTFFGAPRVFSLSARAVRNAAGDIEGAVLTSWDTTVETHSGSIGAAGVRLVAEARRKVDQLGTLASDLGIADDIDDLHDAIAERVSTMLGADGSVVLTPTGDGRMQVRANHQVGSDALSPGQVLPRLQVTSALLAMSQRELFMITQGDAGPSARQFLGDAGGAVLLPLVDHDEAQGVVFVTFADGEDLRRVDRDFARAIGRQCGHAINLCGIMTSLESERRRLAALVDQLPHAVMVLDAPDGTVVIANREATRLWGPAITRAGIRAVDVAVLDDDGRPIRSSRRHPLSRVLFTGETTLGLALTTLDEHGDELDVIASLAPLTEPGGALRGAAIVVQRREHYQAIDQARDQFLSVVAHELRNPLTSLRGNLQLLERRLSRLDDARLDREAGRVQGVIEQVDRVGDLVSRLLDVARADLERLVIAPEPGDAAALVRIAVREMQGQVVDRTVCLTAPDTLPVRWDRVRVQQILGNLLSNAVRHAPEGDIEVTLATPDPDRVTIAVRDHGPGVAPRLRRRLFRLYHTRHESGRGLGIGLYISDRLARAHFGELRVDDAPGGGAVFTLTLPREATETV